MVVTCYKNYGTPFNSTGVPVAGIGKYHPLLCVFAALAGCRFFVGCVLAPQIFLPPTHRCVWRYFIGGFRKMQQVGLWKLKNVALLVVRHQ